MVLASARSDWIGLAVSFGLAFGGAAALALYVRYQLSGPLARLRRGVPGRVRLRCDHAGVRELRDALVPALRGPQRTAAPGGGPGRAKVLVGLQAPGGRLVAFTLEVGRAAGRRDLFELDLRGGRPALLFKPPRGPSLEIAQAIDQAVRALPGVADVAWSADGVRWHAAFDDARR